MTPRCEITVRGYHLDVFAHVNNARYLEFLEEARWQYFGEIIDWLRQRGDSLAIVNININYRQPAYLGNKLEIDATVNKIGAHSMIIGQNVRLGSGGDLIADATVTCVFIDNKTGKAHPLSGELLELINGFRVPKDEDAKSQE